MKHMKTFIKQNQGRSGLLLIVAIVFGGVYLLSVIYPSVVSWNNNNELLSLSGGSKMKVFDVSKKEDYYRVLKHLSLIGETYIIREKEDWDNEFSDIWYRVDIAGNRRICNVYALNDALRIAKFMQN